MAPWVALASVVFVLGGCCKDKVGDLVGSGDKKGLNHPDNDPAVVSAAKEVLTCEWQKERFKTDCEALQKWKKAEISKKGAADKTLINFLEDEDTKVQWIGAEALSRDGSAYKTDAVLAKKVVDALDKATEGYLVGLLSGCVGRSDLKATGLGERVMKMMEEHGNVAVREGLAGDTLFSNRDYPGLYDLLVKIARSNQDPKVRKRAAAAFWTGTPAGKQVESCKLWLELADDADDDVAGTSAYHCAFSSSAGECTGQWDGLLSLIERKAKAGQVKTSTMAGALAYLYGQRKANDAIKKRTIAVARAIVANPANKDLARSRALEFIGKDDPAGKAFAKSYENDPSIHVKVQAKAITSK